MMPSAKTDNWSSAPPENRSSSVKMPLLPRLFTASMHFCTFVYDTPGLGIVAPSRYTAIIATVNKIFLRRSGVLNALMKGDDTASSCAKVSARLGGLGPAHTDAPGEIGSDAYDWFRKRTLTARARSITPVRTSLANEYDLRPRKMASAAGDRT